MTALAPAAPRPVAVAGPGPSPADRPARVLSLDLLRGWDVWLMLFVNEMAGVQGTPAFLKHMPSSADGMTITDVVFPAFLFITGMAVPLALGGRLQRGEPVSRVWGHVLRRVASLLVMGVFMVNGEHVAAHGLIPGPLWIIVSTLGLVLVFAAPAGSDRRRGWLVLRALGLVLLVAAIVLYRTDNGVGLVQMRPRWWGILGLIGWAYLVAATGYLLARERPAALLGGVALLYLFALADESNAIAPLALVRPFVAMGAMLGAHGGLALSGVVLTVALLLARRQGADGRHFVGPALGYAAAMAAAGLLLHSLQGLGPAFWINKVKATVPWCLLSAAITVAVWVTGYVLADVRGRRRWPRGMTMAGENALLIYLLPDLLLSAFALLEPAFGVDPYGALGRSLGIGTVRSILFAWLVVRLSGWMRDRGLRLHL